MKKFALLSGLFLTVISVCLYHTDVLAASDAAPVKLTYSIFFPPAHGQAEAGIAWAKEIEKRSAGRIKIDVFAGGTLTAAPEVYDGVVNGISDIGMSCFAYTRGRFPIMEALDLPMGYPSGKVATLVANGYYKAMKPQALDEVKVLYLHAHGPGLLHTKKPVKKMEDLKGMKIRSTGFSAKVVEALGARPLPCPRVKPMKPLQKGVVDGTFTPIETLKGWKQAEVVKYTVDCPDIGYTTAMFVVMNLKKWNALPDDIKKIFDDTSAEWIAKHGEAWDRLDKEGKEFALSLKNEITALPGAENQRWVTAVAPVIDSFKKNANEKGLPGDKAIAEIQRLLKENGKK